LSLSFIQKKYIRSSLSLESLDKKTREEKDEGTKEEASNGYFSPSSSM
jgi:hypothetical protein